MTYVDGFLLAVPTANREAYRAMAAKAVPVFEEYGALHIVECWSDDVPKGKVTDFYRAVQAKEDEAVVFAWIVWPSKAVRDAGVAKCMTDPRMKPDHDTLPFDGQRSIFGGFETILDSRVDAKEAA